MRDDGLRPRHSLKRRFRREGGAVAVEAALILPLLILITFGLLEWGLVFKDALTVSSSARSGARSASAQPRETDYHLNAADAVKGSLLDAVPNDSLRYLSIYKANSTTGNPVDGGFETCTTCYRFTWNKSSKAWQTVGGASWPAVTQSACGKVTDTDYLGVYVRIEHGFMTGMFGDVITLTDHAVMRLEPIPSNEVCKP